MFKAHLSLEGFPNNDEEALLAADFALNAADVFVSAFERRESERRTT